MAKIRIKNFGPIKEGFAENDGWLDIKKVTVFIGNQGSGKSTIAKAISSMVWLEKAINRGDKAEPMTLNDIHRLFAYQRLGREYFNDDTEIEYQGDLYTIRYSLHRQNPMVSKNNVENYKVPKIMYVPAERNFLAAVQSAYDVTGLPDSLFEFAEEFRKAQINLNESEFELPIKGYRYLYNKREDKSFVVADDHKINLLDASSGFQSLIPLFVVSNNLVESIKFGKHRQLDSALSVDQSRRMNEEITLILSSEELSDGDKIEKVRAIQSRYRNEIFLNIVEEPEQNLYPTSQKAMLYELLKLNNIIQGNSLILTTHSPYIISYLTLAIKGQSLIGKVRSAGDSLIEKFNNIIPENSCISSDETVIYELTEDGKIIKLPEFEGIPSDNNFLNQKLAESNRLFDALLEIEEELWQ